MPILIKHEGLSQGISQAGSALGSALAQRGERTRNQNKELLKQEQQKKSFEVVTDWAGNYDSSKSPMENIGTLQMAMSQSDVDPDIFQPILQSILKQSIGQQGEQYGASQIFGKPGASTSPTPEESPKDKMAQFSTEDLVTMSSNPNRLVNQTAKAEIEKRKIDQRVSEADRKYHTQFAVKQEEKIASLRESIPKKKSALRHSRSAVESGQVGAFSINQIADSIGGAAGDTIRNSQGAKLVTAGKENLLGNMSRVSAKAQNQWFEQRLASMFPKVGQSKEANLTTQEMLEGEVIIDEAYLKKFDELSESDEALYGYPRKDLDRRARQAIEHLEDITFNRSAYRMRQLEESEMGKRGMVKALNKKVSKGTPMTLEMGALFLEKYKDPKLALKNAKRLGYNIPNGEDLKLYLMTSEEFSKRVGGM